MTKKFDVITLDGFIYLVDKEADLPYGTHYVYCGISNTIEKITSSLKAGEFASYSVIASNNPSIDVPQIGELLEEDIEKIKDLCYHEFGYTKSTMSNAHVGGNILEGFLAGYKAAKAKKYDEKDIKKDL